MIGERLADLRKDNQMSQETLGQLLGVGRRTISAYEKDKVVPPDETKIKIAKIFHVSLDYLLGLSREQKPFATEYSLQLPNTFDDEDVELVKKFIESLEKYKQNRNK